MAQALQEELSCVLESALMHLEAEDCCEPDRSLYELQKAHGHLTYTLAMHLAPQQPNSCGSAHDGLTSETVSLLAEICQGFLHTYEERIHVGTVFTMILILLSLRVRSTENISISDCGFRLQSLHNS